MARRSRRVDNDRESFWRTFFRETTVQVCAGVTLALIVAFGPKLLQGVDAQSALYLGMAVFLGTVTYGSVRTISTRRGTQLPPGRPPEPLPGAEEQAEPGGGGGRLEVVGDLAGGSSRLRIAVRGTTAVKATPADASAFVDLNARREAMGLMGYYDAVRFLPVTLPRPDPDGGTLGMEVVRIAYSMLALLNDPDSPPDVRDSVRRRILRLPGVDAEIRDEWKHGRVGILGSQLCLITADRRLLLRRRGGNVLFARNRWDVSVSGFCGTNDLEPDATLNPCLTAEHETLREIGHIQGDPRKIKLLGVTRNTGTGAFDVLLAWDIDMTAQDVIGLLTPRTQRQNRVFDTEVKAIERYVWDSKNLLVNLDRHDIEHAWHDCGIGPADFEPQSVLCIDLALRLFTGYRGPGFLETV